MPRMAHPSVHSPVCFLRNQEGLVAWRSLSGWQTDELALLHHALQLPKWSLAIFCISDVWPSVSSLVLDLMEGILETLFSETAYLLFSSLFIKQAFKRFSKYLCKKKERARGLSGLLPTYNHFKLHHILTRPFQNLSMYYKASNTSFPESISLTRKFHTQLVGKPYSVPPLQA